MNADQYITELGIAAKLAAQDMGKASTASKNRALLAIATQLSANQENLLAANQKDLNAAKENGLESALLDRLQLSEITIKSMVAGLEQVAALADPIGEISNLRYRPSGIQVGQMRVPLGVIGIIYESRPNVTVDAAALCLKSGNACILRGGKEAIHSNQAIAECVRLGLAESGLPKNAVQVVATTDRAAVGALITAQEYVDIIIPRGGKGLIERISQDSTIAVIKHLDGICHTYIDSAANIDQAIAIAYNAKARRYGVCNAMETLLVANSVAADVLPPLARQYQAKGIELRGCPATCQIIDGVTPATDADWDTEYLAAILAIKIVAGVEDAIAHINKHGSGHTDAIVTENYSTSRQFLREVDASSVIVNASTAFADGFEYGLGAEIGISTDKLHARGPVGLEGLTSLKYIVFGNGQTRD